MRYTTWKIEVYLWELVNKFKIIKQMPIKTLIGKQNLRINFSFLVLYSHNIVFWKVVFKNLLIVNLKKSNFLLKDAIVLNTKSVVHFITYSSFFCYYTS